MQEEELVDLCKPLDGYSGKAPWLYWTVELYSHGKYIREYGFFPKRLPLCVYGDHSGGIVGTEIPAKHELETDAPAYLTFNKQKAELYPKMTGKKAYVIISPTVYYRRRNRIQQAKNHRGTIAFPAHGTPGIEIVGEFEQYAQQLKDLPAKYQPVTVCLHMHDINKGLHRTFMDQGLTVVTAGNTSDYRFCERLYSILREFSFSTSNMIGSYVMLSIEMDIPFFIYGDAVSFYNKNDINIPKGLSDPYDGQPIYRDLYNSLQFSNFTGGIDPVIKRSLEEKLGVYDSISRIKLSYVLWKCFLYKAICTRFLLEKLKAKITKIVTK